MISLLLTSCGSTKDDVPTQTSGGSPQVDPNFFRSNPGGVTVYQRPPINPYASQNYGNSLPAFRPQPQPAVLPVTEVQRGPNSNPPGCAAQAMVLIDAKTGGILSARNMTSQRAVASTQKLLTALLVVERGNLNGRVTVTSADTRVEPSKLYVKAGQTYTRRELLNALLVKSCNDVAQVLARDHSGSISGFSASMNAKARQLGARSSNFKNPHGLTVSGQYSTAQDMARISLAAYRDPTIRSIVRQKSYSFRFSTGARKTLTSTNKVLSRMPQCNGMKTGYTRAAGRCLVSSASYRGREVILVQLGTKTTYLWNDAIAQMKWGLDM